MSPDIIKQVAFASGRIVHAGMGKPIMGDIHITAREGPIVATVLEDGAFALSGDLELLFPDLKHVRDPEHPDYTLTLNIRANSAQFQKGFVELPNLLHPNPIVVTIPRGLDFDPEVPPPPDIPPRPDPLVDVGTIALGTGVVNIRGRVYDANPNQNVFAVRAKIYRMHNARTAVQVVRAQRIEQQPQRALAAEAPADQPTIVLNDRSGLMAEQVLQIGAGVTMEYGIITNPSPPTPGAVILRDNLAHRQYPAQPVQAVDMLPIFTPRIVNGVIELRPITTTLSRDADDSAQVVLFTSDEGFAAGMTIAIARVTPHVEYQIIDQLRFAPIVGATVELHIGSPHPSKRTDELGYFSFDGIEIEPETYISCTATDYDPALPRPLLIDFTRLTHEENFYLAPES